MSLYDDDDPVTSDTLAGSKWSTGVTKFTPNLNKPKFGSLAGSGMFPSASGGGTGGGNNSSASSLSTPSSSLPPVINLNSKSGKRSDNFDSPAAKFSSYATSGEKFRNSGGGAGGDKSFLALNDPNWTPTNEYDPMWPNDYHKVVKEMKANSGGSPDGGRKRKYSETSSHRDRERERERDRDRFFGRSRESGFSKRPGGGDNYSDEEDESDRRGGYGRHSGRERRGENSGRDRDRDGRDDKRRGGGSGGGSGAAIAPPPSLNSDTRDSKVDNDDRSGSGSPSSSDQPSFIQKMGSTLAGPQGAGAGTGLGVAAKIMAKYGYKQGQGLGRSEQGMSMALAVEKTSKRGGRIVHEKDLIPPPPTGPAAFGETASTPPGTPAAGDSEYGGAPTSEQQGAASTESESPATGPAIPSITDLMKNPGKVVLCKNMVGPGEVDDELEPEVQEECQGKYGDVQKVVIFEIPSAAPEEAVRIFIEFKRVESAIKAVVDLNGRFFGGRQVQALFYDAFKFSKLQLND